MFDLSPLPVCPQEMFAYATTPAARAHLVPCAIEKFRQLLRQRPDFDRGCYNLGTVFYACAQTMQREAANEFKGVGGRGDALMGVVGGTLCLTA
jgi:hypothetical protein